METVLDALRRALEAVETAKKRLPDKNTYRQALGWSRSTEAFEPLLRDATDRPEAWMVELSTFFLRDPKDVLDHANRLEWQIRDAEARADPAWAWIRGRVNVARHRMTAGELAAYREALFNKDPQYRRIQAMREDRELILRWALTAKPYACAYANAIQWASGYNRFIEARTIPEVKEQVKLRPPRRPPTL
jgi:hypothetical protein